MSTLYEIRHHGQADTLTVDLAQITAISSIYKQGVFHRFRIYMRNGEIEAEYRIVEDARMHRAALVDQWERRAVNPKIEPA